MAGRVRIPRRRAQAYRCATMRTHSIWLLVGTAAVGLGAASFCVSAGAHRRPRRDHRRRLVRDRRDGCAPVRRRRARGPPILHARRPRMGLRQRSRHASCAALIGDRTVTCTRRDVDTYGRIVAVCRSGSADLGAEMVRSGFATAYRRYSNDYVDEENEARAARRGIWAGEFTPPEDYRRDDRREAPAQRSDDGASSEARCDGCYIKGNINGGRRADLPRARLAVVRQHRHRREQRRALVPHRERGTGGRVAPAARLSRSRARQGPSATTSPQRSSPERHRCAASPG